MSEVTQAISAHHRELAQTLAAHVAALTTGSAGAGALAAFLKEELLPHAAGEEKSLYPIIEPLLKTHGRPTATMTVDHEYITDYINQIDAMAQALAAAGEAERPDLSKQLNRLGLQLEALLRVHTAKEERV